MEKNQADLSGNIEIGPRIRRLRKYRQMTQRELAEKVMISPSSITRLESGKIMVSVFAIMEIARALQVPVSAILMDNADDFDENELAIIAAKLRKCTPEQRKVLLQGMERMLDAFFV